MTDDDLSEWERDLGDRIGRYVTAHGVHKQLMALTVALGIGLWLGINYTARTVLKSQATVQVTQPAWVAEAEAMVWAGIALMAIGTVGWIWLDYMGPTDD